MNTALYIGIQYINIYSEAVVCKAWLLGSSSIQSCKWHHSLLSLKLSILNGSSVMDGGLSHSDPDLALHFHYGSTSHPWQMHKVPSQLSTLSSSSLSVTYFFHLLCVSLSPTLYLFGSLRTHKCLLIPYKCDVSPERGRGCSLSLRRIDHVHSCCVPTVSLAFGSLLFVPITLHLCPPFTQNTASGTSISWVVCR